jgi:hypothetical protein
MRKQLNSIEDVGRPGQAGTADNTQQNRHMA